MKFNTPWTLEPAEWEEKYGGSLVSSLTPACLPPSIGDPPLIHRFFDLILLPEGPVSYSRRGAQESNLLSTLPRMPQKGTGEFPEDYACGCVFDTCVREWEVESIQWAVFVTYEQAWSSKGTSLGKLVQSLSLTPGEELEVQVFTWDRTKISKDFESSDLVDKTSQTSLTMNDSAQVVNRMEKEKQWNFGVNVGFEYGVTAGLELGYSSTTSDLVERRREQKQEYTSKAAQQIRTERQIKISTARETGIEERQKRILKNENPTRTVTYNFFETLSHYQVDIAISEVQFAIAIPNKLPSISPEWVSLHEGILKENLLDDSQSAGFDAARRLSVVERTEHIESAAKRLQEAFVAHPGESSEICERYESDLPDIPGRLDDLIRREIERRHLPEHSDPRPPSYEFIASFLEGIGENPSLSGLIAALKYVNDWLMTRAVEGVGYCQYQSTEDLDRAMATAYAVIIDELGKAPNEIAAGSTTEDTESDNSTEGNSEEQYLILHREERELELAAEEDKARFNALRCHIEESLLHYMRAIWLSEDPGVRRERLSYETGIRLAACTEEPLIGFHLNCSVFPVRLGSEYERVLRKAIDSGSSTDTPPSSDGAVSLVKQLRTDAHSLKGQLERHFLEKAQSRMSMKSNRILEKAINDSVLCLTKCEQPRRKFTPDLLPAVLKMAEKRIAEQLDEMDDNEVLENYLNDFEKKMKLNLDHRLDSESEITIDEKGSASSFNNLADAGRMVVDSVTKSDLKSIIVSMPTGGFHCEPVVGQCSAAEDLRLREIEAGVDDLRAKADQEQLEARRREKRLTDLSEEALEPESSPPTLGVDLNQGE